MNDRIVRHHNISVLITFSTRRVYHFSFTKKGYEKCYKLNGQVSKFQLVTNMLRMSILFFYRKPATLVSNKQIRISLETGIENCPFQNQMRKNPYEPIVLFTTCSYAKLALNYFLLAYVINKAVLSKLKKKKMVFIKFPGIFFFEYQNVFQVENPSKFSLKSSVNKFQCYFEFFVSKPRFMYNNNHTMLPALSY